MSKPCYGNGVIIFVSTDVADTNAVTASEVELDMLSIPINEGQ